jgi:hypothetical protein
VGAGGSQEASFALVASVPAGTYHFVLDCIVIDPTAMTFDLLWRRDGSDTELVSFGSSYNPLPGADYAAQPYSYDMPAQAIDFEPGDELVFRYTANGSSLPASWEPNGDQAMGSRDPSITLPVGP